MRLCVCLTVQNIYKNLDFKEECISVREKWITRFWKGAGFCYGSWIVFQDTLPLADRAQTDILQYLSRRI